MAHAIDPINRRIVLDGTNVTAKSIYAAWANWVALEDNTKYPQAFASVGGDDLGSGLSIPPYYFLKNDWYVRPMESSQVLTITGNLFVEGGGDPVVPTLGEFNVLIRTVVPVQAQGISTGGLSGPTVDEIWNAPNRALSNPLTAAAIWAHTTRSLTTTSLTLQEIRDGLAVELARLDAAISTRTAVGDILPANIKQVNDIPISGTGVAGNEWGPR